MQIRQALALAAALLTSLATAAHGRPNIVVVIADDMGYSDIGCYGAAIRTPNIDKLAAGGLRFTNYYVNNMCLVTRASLMTGHYPRTAKPGPVLNPDLTTLPEHLRAAGYTTLMAGKWHLGHHDQSRWPLQRGFDRFYGCIPGATRFFHPEHPRGMTRDNTPIDTPESTTGEAFYTTDAFTDHAIDFIGDALKKPDTPFFLYLAYTAPHWPLQAFEDDIAKYRGKYKIGWDELRQRRYKKQLELGLIKPGWPLSLRPDKVPAWDTLSPEKQDEMDLKMAVYAAMVDRVDQNIGKLTKSLKNHGVFDDTLVLFLSDNGACHEGGVLGRGEFYDIEMRNQQNSNAYGEAWANAGSTPFRLYKSNAHQGGSATPFIAHWPGGIAPREDWQDTPAHLTDVVPTILELAGATYPAEMHGNKIHALHGESLVPAFAGKAIGRDGPTFLEHQSNAFVRDGKWKLVGKGHVGNHTARTTAWELYDLDADRTELDNLAETHPEKRDALIAAWTSWANRVGVFPKRTGKRK